MSNEELLIKRKKQEWGFDHGSQLWKLINQVGETTNATRVYKREDLEIKTGQDRFWDKHGFEIGTKIRLKKVSHTCRWNKKDMGQKE